MQKSFKENETIGVPNETRKLIVSRKKIMLISNQRIRNGKIQESN